MALPEGIHVTPLLTLSRVEKSVPDTHGYRAINQSRRLATRTTIGSHSLLPHTIFVLLLLFVILGIVGEVRAAKNFSMPRDSDWLMAV